MAMALMGKNRQIHWHEIQPRHFPSTAKHVGFNQKTALSLFSEMMDSVDEVILNVEKQIPEHFPDKIAAAILTGMRKQHDRYQRLAS